LAAMQTDLNEFRQSQQRVVRRYDDDLSDTKKLLEKSEMKIKKLENEAALLQDQLRSAHHDLTDTKECLQKTSGHKEEELRAAIRWAAMRESEPLALTELGFAGDVYPSCGAVVATRGEVEHHAAMHACVPRRGRNRMRRKDRLRVTV
ncbi:hypothetical protein DIPPA_15385, partial [Diplonema papillatum]